MAYNVIAIYLRLSCEDTDINSKDESNSITNQRNLIMEYIKSDAILSVRPVSSIPWPPVLFRLSIRYSV